MKLPKTLRAVRRLSFLPVLPLAGLVLCLALPRLGAQTDPLDQWTSHSYGNGSRGIAYGNGQFVAVGATIQTSADSVNWTNHPTNLAQLYGITYGNGQFVAVGTVGYGYGAVMTSTDGATWTLRENGRQFGAQFGVLYGIAYGNGQFVAAGGGPVILTSADGTNWTHLFPGSASADLNGVGYGNGQFVAVGYGVGDTVQTILTSADGASWTERASGTVGMLFGAAYGNGQFVVVGKYGAILTSTDGATWTGRSSAASDLSGIAYGGGQFVAAGGGAIVTSADGTNWISRNSGTLDHLWGVAYGKAEFVVVGDNVILTSGTVKSNPTARLALGPAPVWSANGMSLALNGPVGSNYVIEASADLVNWTPIQSITLTNSPFYFRDAPATNSPDRFYRAMLR